MDFSPFRPLDRRALLKRFGATAAAMLAVPATTTGALAQPVFLKYPFSLGVASGDPLPDGFVIWTRVAPEPLEPGYGMPRDPVEIGWEVASDERFRSIVQKGTAVARPELGHAVHVEVGGLEPGREYWYRFIAGRDRSMFGRAVTAPAPGAAAARARFAVAGCQDYEQGHFTAFKRIAEARPDFVYHYGDYIYEYRTRNFYRNPHEALLIPTVRTHIGDESHSLDDYRQRYAQYKSDFDLQLAHAAAPWFVSWDDHEIINNWVGEHEGFNDTPPEYFLLRRAAAAQAFYENMPLRRASWPKGPAIQLHRRYGWGGLMDVHLLDTRQYRSPQPCGDNFKPACADNDDPAITVLGEAQEKWLLDGLSRSKAQWTVLAQQIMMMPMDRDAGSGVTTNMDTWSAYRVARQRLLKGLHERRRQDVVVLTGDEHQHMVGDLLLDPRDDRSPVVASEFVGTSATSGGDGGDKRPETDALLAQNPHMKFINDQRGFLMCDVTPERWTTELKVLDRVRTPDGALSTRATFVVERGAAGVKTA